MEQVRLAAAREGSPATESPLEAEFSQQLRHLSKRDPVTRLKALQVPAWIAACCTTPSWTMIYTARMEHEIHMKPQLQRIAGMMHAHDVMHRPCLDCRP